MIDLHKLHWGTFTKLHKKYIREHPTTNLKKLESFANHIVKYPTKFSKKAYHKAMLYQNIIEPRHLVALHHSKMKGGASALQKGYASEMRAWFDDARKNPTTLKSKLNFIVHSADPNADEPLMKNNKPILWEDNEIFNPFVDYTNTYDPTAQAVINEAFKSLTGVERKFPHYPIKKGYDPQIKKKERDELIRIEKELKLAMELEKQQREAEARALAEAEALRKELERQQREMERQQREMEKQKREAERIAKANAPKLIYNKGEIYTDVGGKGDLFERDAQGNIYKVGFWLEKADGKIIRKYLNPSLNGKGRRHSRKYGGSWTSALLNPVATLKNSMTSVGNVFFNGRSKLLPSAQQIVEQYGNDPITSMVIMRTPLGKTLTAIANALTWGQLYANMRSNNIDDYFHLQLFVKVKGEWISIEKESTVKVSKKDLEATKRAKKGEILPVGFPPSLTINTLLGKTQSAMGEQKFFGYSAKDNNCAVFVNAMLSANGLANARTSKFVTQNVEGAFNDYTRKMANTITDIGHYADTAMEGGMLHHLLMCGGAFSQNPNNYTKMGNTYYSYNRKITDPKEIKEAEKAISFENQEKYNSAMKMLSGR